MSKREVTELIRWVERIRVALDYVQGVAGIPEDIRYTLTRAVEATLEREADALFEAEQYRREGEPWTQEDEAVLVATASELPIATGYSVEREHLQVLSARLGRRERTIRKRLSAHMLADRVDYWYARIRHKLPDNEE